MVLINSDDFGASKEINLATYQAFKKNLISSTTALVNFEEGLRDAVTYVKSNLIQPEAIGIHLNLTQGRPLTEKMKNNKAFCDNGVFRHKRNISNYYLNRYNRQCVKEELAAQIDYFRSSFGFLPSHIDSHQHVHTKWPILQCVVKVAKKKCISSVRLSRNIRSTDSMVKKVYKNLINGFIRFNRLSGVHLFGDIDEAIRVGIDPKKRYELMVHVNFSANNKTILDIDSKKLRPKLKALFNNESWSLVNYRTLIKPGNDLTSNSVVGPKRELV